MSDVLQTTTTRQFVTGVGDMKLSNQANDLHVTHALGSCIGITIYDPVAIVGGILHFMLPESNVNPARAEQNPYLFADTAIPRFFKSAYELGAQKNRLIVKVAGGAQFLDKGEFFAIGKRNHTAMRKIFWQNGVLVKGEHVGGTISRTLYLQLGTGKVWFTTGGEETQL
jgi:chemotaxis protein CheD